MAINAERWSDLRLTIGDVLDNLVSIGGDRRSLAAAGLMRG